MSRTKGQSGSPGRLSATPHDLPAADGQATPEGSAFAEAFDRITSPQKRACVAWFVRELSRDEGSGR